jgi:hypothetical protein
MRTIHVITGLLLAGAIATGCTRKTEIITPEPYPVGGESRKPAAILRVTPRHHLKNVDTCWVYIKYNSKQAAAKYDDSIEIIIQDGRPMAIFDSLKRGDYFLLAKGWQWSIEDSNKIVEGGAAFTIPDEIEIRNGKDTVLRTFDTYLDVFDAKGK